MYIENICKSTDTLTEMENQLKPILSCDYQGFQSFWSEKINYSIKGAF